MIDDIVVQQDERKQQATLTSNSSKVMMSSKIKKIVLLLIGWLMVMQFLFLISSYGFSSSSSTASSSSSVASSLNNEQTAVRVDDNGEKKLQKKKKKSSWMTRIRKWTGTVIPTHHGVHYDKTLSNNKNKQEGSKKKANNVSTRDILLEKYPNAWTRKDISVSKMEQDLMETLSPRVHESVPDLYERAPKVKWGYGNSHLGHQWHDWWNPSIAGGSKKKSKDNKTLLSQLDGGYLLYSHLLIMKWPKNLHIKFPFRLCGGKDSDGCPAERSFSHTLEFREKYQPWCITKNTIKENQAGWIYTHGFSQPLLPDAQNNNADDMYYGHAMIWARPGLVTKVKDPLEYMRAIMNTLDRSIAQSLQQSNGQVGKFNIFVDGHGYAFSKLPSLQVIKQGITMLQDHYPNRLGMVFMMNLSRPAEWFYNLMLPFITKEVRQKIQVLPHDSSRRLEILKDIMGSSENIPSWIPGGTNTFEFKSQDYYSPTTNAVLCEDSVTTDFITTMPYHAI